MKKRPTPSATYSVRRAGSVYTLLSLLRPASNTLILPLLIAVMSPDELGLFVLLTPVWWLGQAVFTLGSGESLGRLAAGSSGGVAGATLLVLLLVTVMGSLAWLLLRLASETILGIPMTHALTAALALGMSQAVVATTTSILRSSLRLKEVSVTLVLSTALVVGPGVAATLTVSPSAASYYSAAALGSSLVAIVGLIFVLQSRPNDFAGGLHTFFGAIRLGVPLIPQLTSGLVIDLLVRRIVLAAAGLGALGVFGVALTAGNLIGIIIKSGAQAWAPAFFRKDPKIIHHELQKAITTMLTLVVMFVAILLLLSTIFWNQIKAFGLDPLSFASISAIAALSGVPLTILLGLTQLALYQQKVAHAGWVVVVGTALGFLTASVLSIYSWELIAFALPLGPTFSSLLYASTDKSLQASRFLRGTPLLLALETSLLVVTSVALLELVPHLYVAILPALALLGTGLAVWAAHYRGKTKQKATC